MEGEISCGLLRVMSNSKLKLHSAAASPEADVRPHAEAQELGVVDKTVLLQHGLALQQRVPLSVGRPRVGHPGGGFAGGIAGREMRALCQSSHLSWRYVALHVLFGCKMCALS